MEIGGLKATEEDGGAFGIEVALACLQKAGNNSDEQAAEALHLDRGTITLAVLLRKRGNIHNGSVPP